ncbi:hormone-sensitive lipase-like, partial [Chiloscyllium plagiosum]|uniref:hormone-sensitive lipase-like n=1 Tax=Chiloscyllium plagiosum TaxID=36176 RepID=UPI001CB7D13E
DSDELNELCKAEAQLALDIRLKTRRAPRSKFLIVHFHGGGFVAQTSKSHEEQNDNYTSSFTQHKLTRSTGERICLAGDSAGGNLCLTVSMRAASYGIRMPDGIMAAYPATLLQASASPSRLLTFIDPLLPLSVLSKCLSAYAGTEAASSSSRNTHKTDSLSLVRNDVAALLLRDMRLGASAWLNTFIDSSKSSRKPVGLQLWACLRQPLTLLVQLLQLEKPVISHCPVSGRKLLFAVAWLLSPFVHHSLPACLSSPP